MTNNFFQKLHEQMELMKEIQKIKTENPSLQYPEIFDTAKKNIQDRKTDENS